MKKVLVIGSTVVDIIVNLPHLPKTGEDINVSGQTMSLGGCAYNTSHVLKLFRIPYILFSPVGTGFYGRYVRESLSEQGIESPIPTPEAENGCCYCFVEQDGERSFICNRGAEYRFKPEWFDLLDPGEIDTVYICGLDVEEETGVNIVEYLEAHPEYKVYFAPGPHIMNLESSLLGRIFDLSPVLHLNEAESTGFTGKSTVEQAAQALYSMTGETVIVTLGERGAYYHSSDERGYVPGVKACQRDTIGAGDSHIGTVISCRKLGASVREAIATANTLSAAVVETKGALLPEEAFERLHL